MGSNDKSTVHQLIRMLLRPIASLVLKCGMTWKEFSDLSKSAFVEKATSDFGIRGRPTNVSRVSILTGISRKEVKRQRDLLTSEAPVDKGKTTDATRVLSGWHQDATYLDATSNPLLLAESGAAPSFQSLCTHYGGDIPVTTMLKELLKTKAVERTGDGRLQVLLRYYQPADHDEEILHLTVSRLRDHIETVNNNVFPEKGSDPRFGGYADNEFIPESVVPEFRKFLDSRGQAFLEEVDDWLTAHDVSNTTDSTNCVRVGVDLYAIEDRSSMEKSK